MIPSDEDISDLWIAEFLGSDDPLLKGCSDPRFPLYKCHCGICGNWGIIDTRGKVFTPAGVECGMRAFCICPNGRALKRQGVKL